MENNNNNNNNHVNDYEIRIPDHGGMMAVVSGDSEGSSDNEDDEDIFETASKEGDDNRSHGSLLYDDKLDDEDEAYVYMNLRGGKHDSNNNQQQQQQSSNQNNDTNSNSNSNKNNASQQQQKQQLKKPRNSDAIISCPACFSTLSMDTQKHYKYHNQYRAMFVMGITVDWNHRLKYDTKVQGLVRWDPPTPPQQQRQQQQEAHDNNVSSNQNIPQIVAPDNHHNHDHNSNNQNFNNDNKDEHQDPIYYATFCANCRTMVAALDMTDEVYHFYDCLASS